MLGRQEGGGMPRDAYKYGRRIRSIGFDADVWEKIVKLAAFRGQSKSDVVNSALRMALDIERPQPVEDKTDGDQETT